MAWFSFSRGLLVALLLPITAAMVIALPAEAAPPMVNTQTPGWYRTMLGNFEITALSDGTIALPMDKLLVNTTPAEVEKALGKAFLSLPVETSVNAFLVNTGNRLVLIDAGAGTLFGPTLGKLIGNLKASGYQPEQVDEVYLTHLHGDHVGGLTREQVRAFPNAIVRMDKREADYWLSDANLAQAPAEAKSRFEAARVSLDPYVKAGKMEPYASGTELTPGIKAVSTVGHTPGHNIYVIESGGQRLEIWGDLVHLAAMQFAQPRVAVAFDSDSKSAVKQRMSAFESAAKEKWLVAGAHIPFPGLGHVRQEGKGFVWVPVNYSVPR